MFLLWKFSVRGGDNLEYLIQNGELSIMQKLEILTDAAKYDVACTSSGVERKGDGNHMGNCTQ